MFVARAAFTADNTARHCDGEKALGRRMVGGPALDFLSGTDHEPSSERNGERTGRGALVPRFFALAPSQLALQGMEQTNKIAGLLVFFGAAVVAA